MSDSNYLGCYCYHPRSGHPNTENKNNKRLKNFFLSNGLEVPKFCNICKSEKCIDEKSHKLKRKRDKLYKLALAAIGEGEFDTLERFLYWNEYLLNDPIFDGKTVLDFIVEQENESSYRLEILFEQLVNIGAKLHTVHIANLVDSVFAEYVAGLVESISNQY